MKRFQLVIFAVAFVAAGLLAPEADAARIKDIAYVEGVRDNQLLGYGLVVGLSGTGDYGQAEVTVQSTASMLSRMGIRVDKDKLSSRNVAAVMVTADLPAFARSGQKIDVTVSSIGNARSLQGGQLLVTPLRAADGNVYAVGQGAVSVGGFSARGGAGNSVSKNHVTAGRVPNGALVERDVAIELTGRTELRLILRQPDFTTAVRIARRISQLYGPGNPAAAAQNNAGQNSGAQNSGAQNTGSPTDPKPFDGIAQAVDAATVRVTVPDAFADHVPQFISAVETLDVQPNSRARVVVNERTGTVVMGGDVRVREVAVAHGNLRVSISTDYGVSQPNPFGQGDTQVVPDQDVAAGEETGALKVVEAGATIGDVVGALNALGATPRDLIAILQAIKTSGALDAELVIQ
jgi:flagellar P-ring protein precursor FlgI